MATTLNQNNNILSKLIDIVGVENLSLDEDTLERYSRDQSLTSPRKPNYVVWPKNIEQIQSIIKLANEFKLPIVPYSSGMNFQGKTIPRFGGILIDLSRMNRIVEIDFENWNAMIEPGVTFQQLQHKVVSLNLRVAVPFTAPSASVLSTYLERVPVLTASDYVYGNELILDFEVILPNGEVFTVGNPALPGSPHAQPYGPGVNLFRLFIGAQGTFGIVTKMTVKLLPFPKLRKLYILSFKNLEKLCAFMREVQWRQIGLECFALNRFNVACMLVEERGEEVGALKEGRYVGSKGAKKWSEEKIEQLKSLLEEFPDWLLFICLSGFGRRPEEKIAYEEEALREIINKTHTAIISNRDLEEKMLEEIMLPFRWQKKFGFKGSCQFLRFYTKPTSPQLHERIIKEISIKHGYPSENIGGYVLAVERGRVAYCEFSFPCDLEDEKEKVRVKKIFKDVSEALLNTQAFFDTPYDFQADLVFKKAYTYTKYLKELKDKLDPNNIMNPGKLCF